MTTIQNIMPMSMLTDKAMSKLIITMTTYAMVMEAG